MSGICVAEAEVGRCIVWTAMPVLCLFGSVASEGDEWLINRLRGSESLRVVRRLGGVP